MACGANEAARIDFIYAAIADHETSNAFKVGQKAGLFYRHHDPNIEAYQNIVYDMEGKSHVDEVSPNHKIMSNFFADLIDQAIEYLLANGISFDNPDIKAQLSNGLDGIIKKITCYAAVDGRAYGLIEPDGIKPMCFACQLDGNEPCFVPLYDERSGDLMAGIRYWRLTPDYPRMAVLYEPDGFTEYQEEANGEENKPEFAVTQEKRAYIINTVSSEAEGAYIAEGRNYSRLPIVEMGYINNQSSLVGNEGTITAYNMVLSGFVNQVDWNILYWIIENADGMSETDNINFLSDIIKTHVLHASGEAKATPHEITIQYEARAQLLDRLRSQIYEDMGGVDVQKNSANMTATEIKSAYAALNRKCDKIETYIDEFLASALELLGYKNEAWHYQRDVTINAMEAAQIAVMAAPYLDDEATTKTFCEIEGKIDEFEDIQRRKLADNLGAITDDEGGEDTADKIANKVIDAIKSFIKRIFRINDDSDVDTESVKIIEDITDEA